MKWFACSLTLLLLPATAAAQTTLYVDWTATGANNGSSWADAFSTLQDALTTASQGDEIWVAAGTYYPDEGGGQTDDDRSATFLLKNGVAIYGGFAGNETVRSQRALKDHTTILSGDVDGDGSSTGNCYHVVTATGGIDATSVLEGFVIEDGNADGENVGGDGGGLLNDGGSPTILNSRFLGNAARRGGGAYSRMGSPAFFNVVFSGNIADEGGALYNERSNPTLTNVTVSRNSAGTGAGIYNNDSSPTVVNSILWGNAAQGTGGTSGLDCERESFPCRLSEVDPAILERSDSLGDEVLQLVDQGESLTQALQWLLTVDGVVDADADSAALWFRLDGGRPTWVFGEKALRPGSDGPIRVPVGRHSERRLDKAQSPTDVVGDDPKEKHALVLAPYLYFFGDNDSGPPVAALLEKTRGYEGRVTYLANDSQLSANDVGLSDFLNWQGYDAVFVSTHGTQKCKGDLCRTAILTASDVNLQDIPLNDPPGLILAKIVEGRRTIGLTNDFFSYQYPEGLGDAIIYLDACKTYKSPELSDVITGTAGTFFGWSETVNSGFSKAAATTFFSRLIERGTTTAEALEYLQKSNMTTDPSSGATLRSSVSGDELRIREIVWLRNPLTKEDLPTETPYPVTGQLGDGQPDKIPYLVKVDGVNGDPSGFVVKVTVNGFSAEPQQLIAGEQADGEGNVWTVKGEVLVPFDAQYGQEVDLHVVVDLPEGGKSEQEETVTLGNPEVNFVSTIESKNIVGDEIRLTSTVESNVELRFIPEGPDFTGSDTLKYKMFVAVHPDPGCSIPTSTTDGTLQVKGMVFPEGEMSLPFPEEVVIYVPPSIKETLTIDCPGGSFTLSFIHWFAGFYSFHGGELGGENELDEDRGGLVIRNWTPGGDNVIARKVYDRSATDSDVDFSEKTTIELRWPGQ